MTDKTKQDLSDLAPWINRVLLGIVAYFLVQTNSKFNQVIAKLDVVIVTQAAYAERIHDLEGEIEKTEKELDKFKNDIAKFYETYGYLFTDKARKKLE